jgi:hypothetical protein
MQSLCLITENKSRIEAILGTKYAKIVLKIKLSKKALCFLDLTDGTIYRAAKWECPYLKFKRGSIFDESNGMEQLTASGTIPLHNGKPKGFKHELIYPRGENKALGPQPRLPKEIVERKPHPKHHVGLILNRQEPLVVVPVQEPTPISLTKSHGILPIRVFTPRTGTE